MRLPAESGTSLAPAANPFHPKAKPATNPPPDPCPVCGESVPASAHACPDCGASWDTGWDEAATRYDGLDLPDDALAAGPAEPARPPGPLLLTAMVLGGILTLLAGVAMGLAIGHG